MALLAYFLTWTTYGTWLHGDERGSAEDLVDHTQIFKPNRGLAASTTERLSEHPFVLGEVLRDVVERAIVDHAALREWRLDALNVRSNHIHVVVAAPGYQPEIVVGQFKSWATRRLREEGHLGSRTRVWTKKASTRWLNGEASLQAAVDYVKRHQ